MKKFLPFHVYFSRLLLKKQKICIIANNCVSGAIYSDLKKQYLSPTVWVHFDDNDYINFLSRLDYYLSFDLKKYTDKIYKKGICCSLGDVQPVHLHFFHSNNYNEVNETWKRRISRLDRNCIYVIWSSCNPSDNNINKFEQLTGFKNKILLTGTKKSSCKNIKILSYFKRKDYYSGFELQYIKSPLFNKRYLDEWNYLRFFKK